MQTGDLLSPQFDKALRNGLGDRSGWHQSEPKVLVIEGWFLGCTNAEKQCIDINIEGTLSEPLTNQEIEYRKINLFLNLF